MSAPDLSIVNPTGPQQIAPNLPPPSDGNPAPTALVNSLGTGQPMPDLGSSNAPTPTQAPTAPQRPSLWRSILSGALTGMAASAGGKNFGDGLARGAAGELQAEQNRRDADSMQQSNVSAAKLAEATIAHTQAQTALVMRQISNLPPSYQQSVIAGRADQTSDLRRIGALYPVGDVDLSPDHHVALNAVTELTKQNPGKLFTAEPVKASDGSIGFQAFQASDAPLSEAVPLLGIDGKQIGTIPKGTIATQAAKLQINALAQDVADMGAKAGVAQQNANSNTVKADAAQTNALKPKAGSGNGVVMTGSMADGTLVAGTQDELNAAGVKNAYKLPAADVSKMEVARQLVSPGGLFDNVATDVQNLNKAGKLGVAASRWNNILTNKLGTGDQDYARLSTDIQLLQTAVMAAHVGARGGNEMLEHFKSTIGDPTISDSKTLLARLGASWDYINHKAMRIPAPKAAR